MTSANDLLEQLQRDGVARFAATGLATDHSRLTRRVRRDRTVRTSVLSVVTVAAAGAVAFAATHQGSPQPPAGTPTTPVATSEDPVAAASVSVAKQERIEAIAADLAAAYSVTREQAMAAIVDALPPEAGGNAEGWVIAGDYAFGASNDVRDAGAQLVSAQVQQLQSFGVPRDRWLDTIILASILQQEAPAGPSDQAGVSRVILNRLSAGMPLDLESPLAYYLHADTQSIGDDGWAVETPYNTFVNEGLPPGAIGAPTQESLWSAVNPNTGDWLYFLRKPDGRTLLFSDFSSFAEAVDQYAPGTGASD